MNPIERINEMREALKAEIIANNINGDDCITQSEHYNRMANMLNVLEKEFENAEYNYEVESINGKVKTFDEHVVLQSELNNDILLIQPISGTEENIDFSSLVDTLKMMRNSNLIKEDMIIIPSDIKIFRAKLAKGYQAEE